MHYPMLSWPKKNSGSIQLHGHIHARMDYNEQNRDEGVLRYDVGVDANNFYPVSVKQIIWSVTVNGNWRMTFYFVGKDAYLVDYMDYH